MRKLICLIFLVLLYSCKKDNSQIADKSEDSGESNYLPTPGKSTEVESAPAVWPQKLSSIPKRIGFGTEGDISESEKFITESDYQYQYLADDIFNGGWASWNSPTGEFAKRFLEQTNQMGKIPVFTYYNIVPAKNRFQDPAFQNLCDPEVMNKYFADWKLLLQICKSFGKTVIIHYEPDLFGYMQMFKNDPAKGVIKVSQSNFPDAKAYTNDIKGLAQTIVNMRDKYAPNVLLGWHASQWATGYNMIMDKQDPEQIAYDIAVFYKSLQAPFDLTFSEFSDRDAGYDQIVKNKDNLWSIVPTAANGNLNDFDRFQLFLKTLNRQTGQKIILWQIPIGNSLTKTCNNTKSHYKDNRAEYFLQPVIASGNLDKIKAYGDAGVIAFLFGRGNKDCTSFMDSEKDGITGAGETADDDGGYLRKAVRSYYQRGPVILH